MGDKKTFKLEFMIYPEDCFKKYGEPDAKNSCMINWNVPAELQQGKIPKKIFCNKDLITPFKLAVINLITRKKIDELKEWNGCFNIRPIRGVPGKMSLHSWGIAIDVNAGDNPLGAEPKLSPEFVTCFTDAGFDWGGDFKRLDAMHFQIAKI